MALMLLACITLNALFALSGGFDGRSIGGFLAHHIACAVSGRCDQEEQNLVEAYGPHDAATVRALAPSLVYERGERKLPVDWRACRRAPCATAPDDPTLDAHVTAGRGGHGPGSSGGGPASRGARAGRATVFTHVVRRRGRLYVQYWLYYPDSNSELAGSGELWRKSWWLPRLRRLFHGTSEYPGFHRDDWEGAFVRVDPDGTTWIRASSHGHVQGCKWRVCHDRWVRSTGWVRVSRGSHSGHVPYGTAPPTWVGPPTARHPRFIPRKGSPRRVPLQPGRQLRERTSTAEGLRLVPLETLEQDAYRPLDPDVTPPWRKDAYRDPESGTS